MAPRHYYTLFMALSAVVFVAARWFMPQPPQLAALSWRRRLALMMAAFMGGSFGSKLPFLLGHEAGPLTWQAWAADGKTVVGALAGAYLAVEFAKRVLGITVRTGDTFALPLALALAVGRWGCFFHGCCHGIETTLPWGVIFEIDGQPVRCHPTQVYESLFHLAMAGLLGLLAWFNLLAGRRLKLYLIGYCGFRFLTEFIRPAPAGLLGLTGYQWASLVMAAALAAQWALERPTERSTLA